MEFLTQPWPWYVAGPIIGLFVPLLYWAGNKPMGISSSLRHTCAACVPANIPFFKYDWKAQGGWNMLFVLGVTIGGFIGGYLFANPDPIALSESTVQDLTALGITSFEGFIPKDLFSFDMILTPVGFIVMVLGGFLVGFGARYAGGCTSGHAISGISALQTASIMATIGFFAGGLIMTHLIFPLIF